MNKTQLVESIKAKLGEGATKKCAETALNAVLTSIGDAARQDEKVQLIGFGTFYMRKRAARTGRNPKDGSEMKIPGSSTLAFKPSSSFKVVEKPAKKCATKKCATKKPAKKK